MNKDLVNSVDNNTQALYIEEQVDATEFAGFTTAGSVATTSTLSSAGSCGGSFATGSSFSSAG